MSFMPGSSVISYSRQANVRPMASAATLARMLALRLPPASMHAALNGTPVASEGIAASPPLRKFRGFSAPIRAATIGLVTISSSCSDLAPSRFTVTAVASSSMWPISSIAVDRNHVAVSVRTAVAPALEEVLRGDADLALRPADRLVQHPREDRIQIVHAYLEREVSVVKERTWRRVPQIPRGVVVAEIRGVSPPGRQSESRCAA
jgi:hypothetical protein